MPMKWTPLGAVCSQVEHPKMSLTGSRCRQLEPICNGADAKAHDTTSACEPVPFPSAPVTSLLFRQSRRIVRILLTKSLVLSLGLFEQGFILSQAGAATLGL